MLAEAMVFYRHTRVLANGAELISLLRICGPDSLCAALESGFIELAYIENRIISALVRLMLDMLTKGMGWCWLRRRPTNLDELAYRTLLIWTDNRRKSRNLTDRLVRYAKPVRWENPAAQDARNDLLDPDFCNACAKAVVRNLAPGYVPPDEAYYRVRLEAETAIEQPGFTIDLSIETDFDFGRANALCREAAQDAQFNRVSVLTGLFSGLADLKVAASFSDEMAVSPSASAIAESKLGSLLSKRSASEKRIEAFQEWTCEHGRAIREAVAAKRYNFDDVLRLAEDAGRFKDWLSKHPDTSDLNAEYLKAVCNVGWAEKLPSKVVRFLLFTAVGGALSLATTPAGGLAGGAALNALDYFFVDRLVKGWKPNQFVEGPLRTFVQ
jgi:hypothetical protein